MNKLYRKRAFERNVQALGFVLPVSGAAAMGWVTKDTVQMCRDAWLQFPTPLFVLDAAMSACLLPGIAISGFGCAVLTLAKIGDCRWVRHWPMNDALAEKTSYKKLLCDALLPMQPYYNRRRDRQHYIHHSRLRAA